MSLTFFDFFLISLATFRLTRLLVYDKITEFIRRPFMDEEVEIDENGMEEIYYVPTKKGPVLHFFGELLSCYWCTGIWSAAGLFLLVTLAPFFIAIPILCILAIAGFAAIIETVIQNWLE